MKLKKIASLMLAGIMAVSMLAGCKSGSTTSEEPENPVVPASSSVAEYVNQILTADGVKKVKFTDGASLRSAVNTIALKSDVVKPDMIASAYDSNEAFNINGDASVTSKVVDEFDDGSFTTTAVSTWYNNDVTTNSNKDYYVVVDLVDGDMDEFAVANSIANALGTTIAAFPDKTSNGKNIVWSGDVAAVKVYNSKNVDKSAWVVGVMFTKTVTDGTNTAA